MRFAYHASMCDPDFYLPLADRSFKLRFPHHRY